MTPFARAVRYWPEREGDLLLTYILAALAAGANAASSTLQRKANREASTEKNLSWSLVVDLVHRPVWFGGVLAVVCGFLLQAAALRTGALAVVEPILVIELPATLVLASMVFHRRMHTAEWSAALAVTVGLAGLLYVLSPSGGHERGVADLTWAIGLGVNIGGVAALIGAARANRLGGYRAGLLGVAAGALFGLTAALIKAMMQALQHGGFSGMFTAWQTYGMVLSGTAAMFVLQSALNSGTLVAAQPGLTAADPVVSILWGTLAFGESVRGGIYLLLAIFCVGVIGVGMVGLARSPLVSGDQDGDDDEARPGERGDPATVGAAPQLRGEES